MSSSMRTGRACQQTASNNTEYANSHNEGQLPQHMIGIETLAMNPPAPYNDTTQPRDGHDFAPSENTSAPLCPAILHIRLRPEIAAFNKGKIVKHREFTSYDILFRTITRKERLDMTNQWKTTIRWMAWWGLWYGCYVAGTVVFSVIPHFNAANLRMLVKMTMITQIGAMRSPSIIMRSATIMTSNTVIYFLWYTGALYGLRGMLCYRTLEAPWHSLESSGQTIFHSRLRGLVTWGVLVWMGINAGFLVLAGMIVKHRLPLIMSWLWGIPHGGLELVAYSMVTALFYDQIHFRPWDQATIHRRFLIGWVAIVISAVSEVLVGRP